MIRFTYLLLFLLLTNNVFAHKLNAFAYIENNKLNVEVFFASGKPCINCQIECYDKNGKIILKGKTNKEGTLEIDLSKAIPVTLTVNAGMGHSTKTYIETNDSESEIVKKENNIKKSPSIIKIILGISIIFLFFGIFFALKKRKSE